MQYYTVIGVALLLAACNPPHDYRRRGYKPTKRLSTSYETIIGEPNRNGGVGGGMKPSDPTNDAKVTIEYDITVRYY